PLSGARAAPVRRRVVRGAACTYGAAAGEAGHDPAPRRRRRQARAVPAAPRRAEPFARTARRAPPARVSAAGADSACRTLPARAGAGRPHPGSDGDAGGGHPRDAHAVRRHARDVPGRETSSLRRDDRDARRRARRRHDRPPRGLPLRWHERPRAVHARCGAGRSRREPLLRRHPCRRPAAAGDRHERRARRAGRAVWRAGRARGDHAGTSPARLPFAQHGPGVDPGREGADPRRTPRRLASEAPRGARSGALATPGFSAAVAETGLAQYAPEAGWTVALRVPSARVSCLKPKGRRFGRSPLMMEAIPDAAAGLVGSGARAHAARPQRPPRTRRQEAIVADTDGKLGKGLNIGLWVAQVLLFLAFGAAGGMKLFSPAAVEMAKQQLNMPYALTYFIGVSEFAGALGMILPAPTRIHPKPTVFAGIGLLVVMI